MTLGQDKRHTISGNRFVLEVSELGAIVTGLWLDKVPLLRPVVSNMRPGDKGGMFVCPQFFGRHKDRTISFEGNEYQLSYPPDIDADKVDPDGYFLHGFEHFLPWQVRKDGKCLICFLDKDSFPEDFPFKHQSEVRYEIIVDEDTKVERLQIQLRVGDVDMPAPFNSSLHPFFNWTIKGHTPSFKGTLHYRFENPESRIALPDSEPVMMRNHAFLNQELPTDVDHGFVSMDGEYAINWGDIVLRIDDLTSRRTCSVNPLMIWTSAAIERGCFGVEPWGLPNLIHLVGSKKAYSHWLPICFPGQVITRVVEFSPGN